MATISPPRDLLQRIANNPSVDDFVNSFGYLRATICRYLQEAGHEFHSFKNILDFGCGVGRFLYAFEAELGPDQKLWGCDVYQPCAKWCQENIKFAEVTHSSIHPPLPYEAGKFDLVYALSVFTHMHLETQFKWAWETYRVLEPGGMLFATIHGPAFIPMFYETYRSTVKEGEFYSFDDGLFALLSFHGKAEDEGQVDVAAAHTPEFAKQQFSAFELLKRFPESQMAAGQDTYIFRKPEHGRTIERPLQGRGAKEQCSWEQKLTALGGSQGVELTFDLAGHDTFRVYPCIETVGLYSALCEIEILSGDTVIATKNAAFNTTRVFGKTHHAVMQLEVPPHTGKVTARLKTYIGYAGSLGKETAKVRWDFPNWT